MDRRLAGCLLAVFLMSMAACAGSPSTSPEQFALQVAQAVAQGDWSAYRPLALGRAKALSTDSNPTASRATFANLVEAEEDGIRAGFERVVRARPLRAGDLATARAVVDATEPDRWQLHVERGSGASTGLSMTLQRFADSYRVVHLYVR
jgi:hypothetical protein